MTLVLNGTTGVSSVDGSASTPAIQGTDSNTGVFFPAADTVAIATGGSERLRADSSGNVGIGTSSPGARLHVAGGASQVSGSNGVAGITNGNTSGGMKLFAFTAAGTANGYFAIEGYDKEYGRFDSSGNFLFNKTSTAASGSGICFQTNDSSQFYRGGDGQAIQFFRSSTQVGNISVTGTATAYNTSSDYRLKEAVAPMSGALAKVAALKPVTYKWKADGSDGEGFIAHELAEVVPGCVTGEKDAVDVDGNPIYQSIDTSFLVATLTAAIQEQQALIESLTARIAALEAA